MRRAALMGALASMRTPIIAARAGATAPFFTLAWVGANARTTLGAGELGLLVRKTATAAQVCVLLVVGEFLVVSVSLVQMPVKVEEKGGGG